MLDRGELVRLNSNASSGIALCFLKPALQIRRGCVFVPLFAEEIPIYYLYSFFVVISFLCWFYVDLNGQMVTSSRVFLRLPSDILDPSGSREVGRCVVLSVGLPNRDLSPVSSRRLRSLLIALFSFLPLLSDVL